MLMTRIPPFPPGVEEEAQLAVPALIFISGCAVLPSHRAWAAVALWRAGGARYFTAHIVLAFVSQAALKKCQTGDRGAKVALLDKCQKLS